MQRANFKRLLNGKAECLSFQTIELEFDPWKSGNSIQHPTAVNRMCKCLGEIPYEIDPLNSLNKRRQSNKKRSENIIPEIR